MKTRAGRGRATGIASHCLGLACGLVLAAALGGACGGEPPSNKGCGPLVERRCQGQRMLRQCRSTQAARCNLVGAEEFRKRFEAWQRERGRG